jgi:hypothetical protein
VLDGDEWVINGHKWFTSARSGADLAIAMVVTDPDAHPYGRASMICVPTDNPGFNLVRPITVMGHDRRPRPLRDPLRRLPGAEGEPARRARRRLRVAQDRLGPGAHPPLHAGDRDRRAGARDDVPPRQRAHAFGGPLADKQFVQEAIAASRMEIDQARLLTLYAAWKMDTEGKRAARQAISAIKIVAANMVMDVLDRAIQIHGSLGMTDDTPLAALWRFSRMLRLADGPDEVHKMVLARRELNRWSKRAEAEAERRARAQARAAADLMRQEQAAFARPFCNVRKGSSWISRQRDPRSAAPRLLASCEAERDLAPVTGDEDPLERQRRSRWRGVELSSLEDDRSGSKRRRPVATECRARSVIACRRVVALGEAQPACPPQVRARELTALASARLARAGF